MFFGMTGKLYRTDEATLHLLRDLVAALRAGGDTLDAIAAVMHLGLYTGRIVQVG